MKHRHKLVTSHGECVCSHICMEKHRSQPANRHGSDKHAPRSLNCCSKARSHLSLGAGSRDQARQCSALGNSPQKHSSSGPSHVWFGKTFCCRSLCLNGTF